MTQGPNNSLQWTSSQRWSQECKQKCFWFLQHSKCCGPWDYPLGLDCLSDLLLQHPKVSEGKDLHCSACLHFVLAHNICWRFSLGRANTNSPHILLTRTGCFCSSALFSIVEHRSQMCKCKWSQKGLTWGQWWRPVRGYGPKWNQNQTLFSKNCFG